MCAACTPRTVTGAVRAFLRMCLRLIRVSVKPFERAVRTYSARLTSMTDARSWRENSAIAVIDNVNAGSIRCRNHWPGFLGERDVADRRQQAELQRQQQDQHQADPEVRHRYPARGDEREEPVDQAVGAQPRDEADRESDEDGQDDREDRDRQRHR
jgi:hypothetical protein